MGEVCLISVVLFIVIPLLLLWVYGKFMDHIGAE